MNLHQNFLYFLFSHSFVWQKKLIRSTHLNVLLFVQVIELRRPTDSRLEHVDFDSLFSCLSVRQVTRVFASLLLERRVIFVADKLRWGSCTPPVNRQEGTSSVINNEIIRSIYQDTLRFLPHLFCRELTRDFMVRQLLYFSCHLPCPWVYSTWIRYLRQ